MAALAVSLTLGAAFVVVSKLRPPPSAVLDHPANPLTDEQSRAQVVEPAKQIVALAGLHTTSAGYMLMSCKNRQDPPYRGAIYLTFAVPTDVPADTYFPAIATTLVSNGWTQGIPPNEGRFGSTISKDDVTATVYGDRGDPTLGILRLHGQCRNMNDHRNDGWTEIGDQLKPD